ncbi:MAG: DNA translocase FtsK 4TM domain-containing protein [Planctomycetes bacterium]|nr:DNA translocase FtsK 4TM domain-containing protein [Planctomycetota bacterium]
MSKTDPKDEEPKGRKRSNRFVPIDELPKPGLSQRAREVVALAMCGGALYGMLCLATFAYASLDGEIPSGPMQNLGGGFGYYLAFGFAYTLGFAGWVPFVMLLVSGVCIFVGRDLPRPTIKALGTVVFAAMLAILFAGADGEVGITAATPCGAGGMFGRVASPRLEDMFGNTGRLLLVGFGGVIALMIATEWLFSQLVARTLHGLEAMFRRLLRRPQAIPVGGPALDGEAEDAPPRRRRARGDKAEAGADAGESDESAEASRDDGTKRRRTRAADVAEADGDEAVSPKGGESEGGAEPAEAGEPPPTRASRRKVKEPGKAVDKDADADLDADLDADVDAARTPPSGDDPGQVRGEVEPPAAPIPAEPPKVDEPAVVVPTPVVIRPKPQKPKPKPKPKKAGQAALPFDGYPFPPIELFREPVLNDATTTTDVLQKGGQAIVNKLANFGIQAEVVEASVGPAVTQYELRLAESIRVNKVVGFESDLAAALRAVSVRVVAPIPGKDTIGIEVPNPERQKVFMRDLLDQFGRSEDLAIPLYLGKDVAGNPIVEDLARMPHLLIAGTTGSGKSVCINTILLSVLMTRTPQQVKLILVDPKMVELQAYKRVPHLCCDVVTNMKKAPGVLQWAVDEMENRYALLSAAGVNHIKNYNRLGQQELAKRLQREPDPERVQLPYVVIVIDEFADLMNVAQNEVEELIQRLAQKSRAVGMHVILATQRPSSEVITGIIKANLPTQIAFKVNRRIDSRVILDANGAEKLLGYGDMLYMPPGGGALLRAQGTFVADDEMQAVVKFLEEHGQEPQFTPSLMQTQSSSRPAVADRDERYREAVEIVLGQQRGSATLLQRALAVGYTRATRLLELMEEDGLVGPFVGSKSRDVLLTLEEWRAREEQREAEAEVGDDGSGEGSGEADGDELEGEPAAATAAEAPPFLLDSDGAPLPDDGAEPRSGADERD